MSSAVQGMTLNLVIPKQVQADINDPKLIESDVEDDVVEDSAESRPA